VSAPHHEAPVLQLQLDEPGYGVVVFYDEDACSGFHIPFRLSSIFYRSFFMEAGLLYERSLLFPFGRSRRRRLFLRAGTSARKSTGTQKSRW
jgi:hypothetical protein